MARKCQMPASNCTMSSPEGKMLWTIVVVLFILWLLGFTMHVGGGLVHILLVIALVVVVLNLLRGRRAV
jgi:hypothetical protein